MTSLLIEARRETGTRSVMIISERDSRVWMNGECCQLTAQEFRLLHALARSARKPCTREKLLCDAWGYQSPGKSRTVDVHVQRLRRKLGDALFETIHGVGYRLLADPIPTG